MQEVEQQKCDGAAREQHSAPYLFVVLYSDEVDPDLKIAVNWYVTPGTRLVTLTSDVSLNTVLFSSLLGEGMISIVSQLFPF